MTGGGPVADARLALQLLASEPGKFGGAVLRGGGALRDRLVEDMCACLGAGVPFRRLPVHVDDARLIGGVDVAASLAAGRPVPERGLLAEIAGGVLVVPMAERMEPGLAGRLSQAQDRVGDFALLLLDDGVSAEEAPPPALLERAAFQIDLTHATDDGSRLALNDGLPGGATYVESDLDALASLSLRLGIASQRPPMFALRAARAHAAAHGFPTVRDEDLAFAVRTVLAPRATRIPDDSAGNEEAEAAPEEAQTGGDDVSRQDGDAREEVLLDAALAAIPPDVLERLAALGKSRNGKGVGSGQRGVSKLRGRPLTARPGLPRGGARLALVDTLRAAVPWQPLRRREARSHGAATILLRKEDLRVRRFQERSAAVTIFCVDASGSAAMARLAEAKGAVERLLAQAYVRRTEVALIAFRGGGAELLLPPTRSLTRARRALAELPGGGGTPLASGITLALHVAEGVGARGYTPFVVVLTDGSANIDAAGAPGRGQAKEDAQAAAGRLAQAGCAALVIDISPRPRPEAEAIAAAMSARYLPLPLADSAVIERAVSSGLAARAAA